MIKMKPYWYQTTALPIDETQTPDNLYAEAEEVAEVAEAEEVVDKKVTETEEEKHKHKHTSDSVNEVWREETNLGSSDIPVFEIPVKITKSVNSDNSTETVAVATSNFNITDTAPKESVLATPLPATFDNSTEDEASEIGPIVHERQLMLMGPMEFQVFVGQNALRNDPSLYIEIIENEIENFLPGNRILRRPKRPSLVTQEGISKWD